MGAYRPSQRTRLRLSPPRAPGVAQLRRVEDEVDVTGRMVDARVRIFARELREVLGAIGGVSLIELIVDVINAPGLVLLAASEAQVVRSIGGAEQPGVGGLRSTWRWGG